MEEEIWKEINYFKLKFLTEISNKGNLRKNHDGEIVNYAIPTNSRGYKQIGLYDDEGKRHSITIHKIVGMTFLSDSINECINHKDGDKFNNSVSNLEWVTKKYNTQHGKSLTKYKRVKDFTDEEILNIINDYLVNDIIFADLANKYNVNRETIRTIISFRAKKVLSDEDYIIIRNKHKILRMNMRDNG